KDSLILEVTQANPINSNIAFTPPGDWTLKGQLENTTFHQYRSSIYWRRADGTESGTISVGYHSGGNSATCTGQITAVSGCIETGDPFEDYQGTWGTDTTAETPSTTTAGPNRLAM